MSAGVTRWLHWMTALEKAQLADFPQMARMAKGNSILLRMISARWIELNPRHLFDTLVATAHETVATAGGHAIPRYELGQQLIQDWSQRDPAAVIAALSGPDFPATLRDLRYTVLNAVMLKDPELGLKTMAEWRVENYGTGTEGIAKWAAANPRHAAEFALAHPAGYTTQTAMEVIGKEWAKSDPQAALTFAAGLKDKYGSALAAGIVKEWAGADIAGAAEWLAAADARVRNRLSGPMVEIWAKTDTAGAMEWIQDNLSGSGMDEAIGAVLTGAAEKDVTGAASLVADMEASQARTKAALSVARKWFPGFQSGKSVPQETLTWLAALDPASVKHVVEYMGWQWAGNDSKSLMEFLTSPAGAHVSSYAFTSAAREVARQNPEAAFDWAGRLPAEHQQEVNSTVFREWQQSRPAAAMEWLHKLPVSDSRRESFYLGIVHEFIPGRQEAILLARSLAGGGTDLRSEVQKLSMPEARKSQLLDRLQVR